MSPSSSRTISMMALAFMSASHRGLGGSVLLGRLSRRAWSEPDADAEKVQDPIEDEICQSPEAPNPEHDPMPPDPADWSVLGFHRDVLRQGWSGWFSSRRQLLSSQAWR